ncbi:p21 protein (Cdc42 Rac)-activated kinase [Tulasnella sp. 419]|nr:p21 protein (Cdc42 Rac)-activated kinase [Tulasnella sp. 419]
MVEALDPRREYVQRFDLSDSIELADKIGSDCHSVVWKGLLRTEAGKVQVIVKELLAAHQSNSKLNDERIRKRFYQEISILSKVCNTHIVPFFGYIISAHGFPSLVSSWYPNGNIVEYLRNQPNTRRPPLLIQITQGLDYLHDLPLIHGDIRADNILVDIRGFACISDYGMSSFVDDAFRIGGLTIPAMEGAPRFLSPEILNNQPRTIMSDMWAFGCVAIQVMTDRVPYSHINNNNGVQLAILRGDSPLPSDYTPLESSETRLWDRLRACWQFDPAKRPSISAIISDLQEIYPPGDFCIFTPTVHLQPPTGIDNSSLIYADGAVPAVRSMPSAKRHSFPLQQTERPYKKARSSSISLEAMRATLVASASRETQPPVHSDRKKEDMSNSFAGDDLQVKGAGGIMAQLFPEIPHTGSKLTSQMNKESKTRYRSKQLTSIRTNDLGRKPLDNVISPSSLSESSTTEWLPKPLTPLRSPSEIPSIIWPASDTELQRILPYVSREDPTKLYVEPQGIGGGATGPMYVAKNIQGSKVAVKILNWGGVFQRYSISTHLDVLRKSRHPNILDYVGSYFHEERLWVVTEYLEGMSLKGLINKGCRFDSPQIAFISRGVLQAIEYLHAEGVIHRDISSYNIFLGAQGIVKLTDFSSCITKPTEPGSRPTMSNLLWAVPETARGLRDSEKIDIWCLGIVGIEMLQGRLPNFMSMDNVEPDVHLEDTSLKEYLNEALTVQAEKPLSARDLLQHSFFNCACQPDDIGLLLSTSFS